jgi:hypothetical protein
MVAMKKLWLFLCIWWFNLLKIKHLCWLTVAVGTCAKQIARGRKEVKEGFSQRTREKKYAHGFRRFSFIFLRLSSFAVQKFCSQIEKIFTDFFERLCGSKDLPPRHLPLSKFLFFPLSLFVLLAKISLAICSSKNMLTD